MDRLHLHSHIVDDPNAHRDGTHMHALSIDWAGIPMPPVQQVAAVPYRFVQNDVIEILLITNRGGLWALPKGHIDKGHSPHTAVEIEAFEEAGINGTALGEPISHYSYFKVSKGLTCVVSLYAMRVDEVAKTFPERAIRDRRWVLISEAPEVVEQPQMAAAMVDIERAIRAAHVPKPPLPKYTKTKSVKKS